MLDHSSKRTGFGSGDPLSDMLRGLRLDGVDYGRCQMTGNWGIDFPAQRAARFHFIGQGSCWLLMPNKEWIELGAGDAVLLPRGSRHVLASAPRVHAVPLESYEVTPITGNIFDVQGGGSGDRTLLFCGSMHFNVDDLHPLLRMMPDMMRAHELTVHEPGIPHLLDAMVREVALDRVGSAGILARLADVLGANIIRSWVERGCGDATGWIEAVRNPDVGRVLAAIHLNPSHDWTVAALAKIMGASRSGFAERFATVVGETPARYVAQVRMHQARQWLERDSVKVSVAARRLGYESEAAFGRAFKRIIGAAPSQFRKGMRSVAFPGEAVALNSPNSRVA
ncbi:AraC family transcriptional regulator [Rhizobium laguerreae]|uniref:AraC family transcriptional regulator n=1 Tax=Rhizobium laguerreae TaxID=1076926 RepID=UPI001C9114AF|nr:AraC family transcriptional regulator [Rhizobium laguerreae]MBY3559082.1 AraC family transcriptional regulator [Rhizobium laguerreae]